MGSLDENQGSQPPDQQGLEAGSYFPWIFALSEKCNYHRGRNCKCRYKVHYQRHSTTRGRAHREAVCLDDIETRQRFIAEEKGCGHPLVRSTVRGKSSHLLGQFFWVFVFFQANYLVSFSTLDLPWDPSLGCACTPQPRWISK